MDFVRAGFVEKEELAALLFGHTHQTAVFNYIRDHRGMQQTNILGGRKEKRRWRIDFDGSK